MNNIENESTFFVSIERRKLNQNSNNKFNQPKYFVKSIKITKSNSSLSNIPSSKIKNDNAVAPNTLFNSKKVFINIPNLKANNSILNNKAQKLESKPNEAALLFPKKKSIVDEDLDLDLNIDDTDENKDRKFKININKPKLPLYNMSYFENKSNINNNPNINSLVLKSKNYHQNLIGNKSKSCSFENKNLVKWDLNQKISALNTKIDMLKNLLKRRSKDILELQIFFEKNNSHRKIKKFVLQSDIAGSELKKQIFKLKMEKLKCEEKYVSKKKCDEKINKENLLFSNLKSELIEKILDYRIFIMENRSPNILFTNNDEATIVNDSNIFDNYLNTIEDKNEKENNIIELKNIDPKNISLNNVTEEEDSIKINFNELKSFKNTNNYFTSKFLVTAKTNNRNISKGILDPNSKFNVWINCNKIK